MKKSYKSYDEDFKKTIVSLYESGKKFPIYHENMAYNILIYVIGLISIKLLLHLLERLLPTMKY